MSDRKAAIAIERAGDDEAAFLEVFELAVAEHAEVGYVPLDPEKAAGHIYRVLAEGMSFVARGDGEAIGSIGLTELGYWYSQETFLQDGWLYVKPEHRGGQVGVALMQAAREEGQKRGKIVMITVMNPDRRIKKTDMSLLSQRAGFVPFGYTIALR